MNPFVLNVLLALLWAAINANFTVTGFLVGGLIGYIVVGLSQPLFGGSGYLLKVWHVVYFVLFFLYELIRSSVRVAVDVLHPNLYGRISPGIVGIPLDVESEVEITLLANIVTLTPGPLSLDLSDDRRTLYIHSMYGAQNPDAIREEIKSGLERRVLEVMR